MAEGRITVTNYGRGRYATWLAASQGWTLDITKRGRITAHTTVQMGTGSPERAVTGRKSYIPPGKGG